MRTKKGFTLIEMIIYVALVSILMVVIVKMSILMTKAYGHIDSNRGMTVGSMTVLERLVREIRDAKAVNLIDNNASRLIIVNQDDSTTEFYLDNGVLALKKDGIFEGPLLSKGVILNSIKFYLSSTPVSEMVSVVVSMQSGSGDRQSSETFYISSVLRGSY
jgi:prepilin-type N-terminal cleavage/methylation domain-containing protein